MTATAPIHDTAPESARRPPRRTLTDSGWPFDPARRRENYGFFGPDSPTWRVWSSPTSLIAFQRSVVLEHFDPFLTAAVADRAGIYTDPRGRLDSTLSYFLIVALADGRSAIEASDLLTRVHADATGIEPISGKRYSANNPDSQLWIHLTGWHSVLKCYEMYGPGPLTPTEERRYWAECAVAAQLQTFDPAAVPADRDGIHDYFAAVRPRLCTSERARRGMHYLLRTPLSQSNAQFAVLSNLTAPAVIATLPRWMRELGDMDQPSIVDVVYRPLVKQAIRIAARPHITLTALRSLPMTRAVYAQHFRGMPPLTESTVTPQEARARLTSAHLPRDDDAPARVAIRAGASS